MCSCLSFSQSKKATKTKSSTTLVGNYTQKLPNPGTKIQTTPLLSKAKSKEEDEIRAEMRVNQSERAGKATKSAR
jgi:hypothetical protein